MSDNPSNFTSAPLTPHVPIQRVAVVANIASGSVGPNAPEEMAALLQSYGLNAEIHAPPPSDLIKALKTALESGPDLLVVLAGDGTARAAASLCGPNGPLIAPLPGGTMNMLPRALYGQRPWKAALSEALTQGVAREVGGGEIDGQAFFVAAILGSPALWAPAREAARHGRIRRALLRARLALRGAFTAKLRFSLDGVPGRAEALSLICPLVSKAMTEETALEAVAIDPSEAGEVVRIGFRALAVEVFGPSAGDWRDDPAVNVGVCHAGRVWARGPISAILDGEHLWFGREAKVRFVPNAFRALVAPSVDTGA